MKKASKFISILILFLVFVACSISCEQNKKNRKENYIPLEIPTAYENYKVLDSLTSNEAYNFKIFYTDYDERITRVNDSIFCIVIGEEVSMYPYRFNSKFYRINKLGAVIDSLTFVASNFDKANDYIIDFEKGFYLSWLMDGDKTHKPIQLINNEKIHTKAETLHISSGSDFLEYRYNTDSISHKRFQEVFFLKDKQWYKIIATDDFHISSGTVNYDYSKSLQFNPLKEIATLDFFHKIEKVARLKGSFNPTGGRPEHWLGTGFYTLNKFEKIKFKIDWLKMYLYDNDANTPYDIYTDSLMNFMVIKEMMVEGYGSKQYLIQKKQVN